MCRELLREELEVISGSPPARITQHVNDVLEHTIGRRQYTVRGRLVDGEAASEAKRRVHHVNHAMEVARVFLNGDGRLGKTQHYEQGCCTDDDGSFNMDKCLDNILNACVDAGIIVNTLAGLPSKNRWGSKSEHDAEQSAQIMFFNLGPRCLHSTTGKLVSGARTMTTFVVMYVGRRTVPRE